jgi:IMP cyclohydrolase
MDDLTALLAANPYPGRGLVLAATPASPLVGYFVTGRSSASREREIKLAGEALVVAPLGEGADDPLRHYAAARQSADWLVCGNGRQVDTVLERLEAGAAPAIALTHLEHEPDDPIFTDRITIVVSRRDATGVFGIARKSLGGRDTSDILTMTVSKPAPGDAVLLTTYWSDGRTIQGGRPFIEAATGAGDAGELLAEVWSSLGADYRVAAMVVDPAKSLADAPVENH